MKVMDKQLINDKVLGKALTYEKYYQLIKELLREGKTTGSEQPESRVKHARLNFQRMKRVYRTTKIDEELKAIIEQIDYKQLWLVISEGWCGDAAQSLPAIARIAEQNDNIDLKILLRDENPEIMSAYTTNGSKSIPKLIALDERTKAELFTWGPRPKELQDLVLEQKMDKKMDQEALNIWLHREYTQDKTQKLQKEMKSLLKLALN
jgi:hypothetical protein